MIRIGDGAAKTFTGNFDNVRLDLTPGETASQDTTPPTVPGKPTGQGTAPQQIDLTWPASTDTSLPITYRVYRDGGGTPIGSTSATSLADQGLAPGSTHTYTVDAVDAAGNESAMGPVSDPIQVAPDAGPIFSDDFSSGDFSNWTSVTRLSISSGVGSPAPPSARAQVTNQSAFAVRTLGQSYGQACYSANVNLSSGNNVVLFTLRTATDGPLIRTYVGSGGTLVLRSDFSGSQFNSGVALGSGWHAIELCGTVGTNTSWDLYRDGIRIVNAWTTNTGPAPIGMIRIGDGAAKTFTGNFDNVRLDLVPN
jgi:hypothetical protein